MCMELDCSELSIKMDRQGLLYKPQQLSMELMTICMPYRPFYQPKDMDDMLTLRRSHSVLKVRFGNVRGFTSPVPANAE